MKQEKSREECIIELRETIKRGYKFIEELRAKAVEYCDKEGWVVETENHVNVGFENGMNGTAFTIKSAAGCLAAVVFDTEADARNMGADYYLLGGDDKPLQMIFTEARSFFETQSRLVADSVKMLEEIVAE